MSTTRPNVTRVVRPRSGSGLIPQNNSLQSLPPEPPSFSTFDFSKRPRSRDLPASPVTSSRNNANKAESGIQNHGSEDFLQRREREKQVAAWDAQLEARKALWNELSPEGKGEEFKNDDDDDASPNENHNNATEGGFKGPQDTNGDRSSSTRAGTGLPAAAVDALPEASHVPLDFFAEALGSSSHEGEPAGSHPTSRSRVENTSIEPTKLFEGVGQQDNRKISGYGGNYGDAAAEEVSNPASAAAGVDYSRDAAVAELSTYLQQLRGQDAPGDGDENSYLHNGLGGSRNGRSTRRGASAVVFPDDFDTRLERMSRRDLFPDRNEDSSGYLGDEGAAVKVRDSTGAPPWAGYIAGGSRGKNDDAASGGGGAWAAYQGALAAEEEQRQEKEGGGGHGSRAPPVDPALLAGGLAQIAELDSQLAAVQDRERAAAAAVRAQSRDGQQQQQQQHGGALSGEAAEPARPKRVDHARSLTVSRLEVEESPRGGGGGGGADTGRSRKFTVEDEASTADSAQGLSARDRAFLTDMGGRGRRHGHHHYRRGGLDNDDENGPETARSDATSQMDTARSSVQNDHHRAANQGRGGKKKHNMNGGAPAKDFVAANVAKARAARGNAATSSLTPDEESRVASLVGDLSDLLDGSAGAEGGTSNRQKGKDGKGIGKHKSKKGGSKSKGDYDDDDDEEGDAAEVLEAQLAAAAAAAAEEAVWQAMAQWGVEEEDISGGGGNENSGAAKAKRLAAIDEALAALGAKEPITLGKVHSWSGADLAAAQAAADAAASFEDDDPATGKDKNKGQGRNGDVHASSSEACGELALEVARQQRQVAQRMQELDDQLKRLGGAQCLVADRNLPSGTPRLQPADVAAAAFTTATGGAGAGAGGAGAVKHGPADSSGGSPLEGGGRGLAELRKRRRQRQAAEQEQTNGENAAQHLPGGNGSNTDRTTSPRPNMSGGDGGGAEKAGGAARDENGNLMYVVSRSQISLAVAEARRRNDEDRARLARAAVTTTAEATSAKGDLHRHTSEAGAGAAGEGAAGDLGAETDAAQRAAAEAAEAQRREAVEAEDRRRLQALLSSVGPDVVNLRERRASAAEASAQAAAAAAAASAEALTSAADGATKGITRRRPEDGSPTGSLSHREHGLTGSENKSAGVDQDRGAYYSSGGGEDGGEETAARALEEKQQERRRKRAERKALHEKQTNKGAQLPPAVAELFRAPFPAAEDA